MVLNQIFKLAQNLKLSVFSDSPVESSIPHEPQTFREPRQLSAKGDSRLTRLKGSDQESQKTGQSLTLYHIVSKFKETKTLSRIQAYVKVIHTYFSIGNI